MRLNQKALRRVVEEIFALLELVLDGTTLRLPPLLQAAAIRLMCPAEAALRRLIVIAARGLEVKLPQRSGMPLTKPIIAKTVRPLSFQLFDTRKDFNRPQPIAHLKTITPRIHSFAPIPLISTFFPTPKKQKTSAHLCRRFEAFKTALENIPQQAKRLALWQAKRLTLKVAKFRSPLRPGAPPGARRKPILEIDHILKECQFLASSALREAPS